MRRPRSHRSLLTICLLLGVSVSIYLLRSADRRPVAPASSILSQHIDARLQVLRQQFGHVNFSMLLDRSPLNRTPSITYQCRELCGGWGDRLRGITSTYVLAILSRRRFYIDMPYPCDVTNFLQPNLYDWRPIELESSRSRVHLKITHSSQLANVLYKKISSADFITEWSNYDDIYITTNSDYIRPVLANPHLRRLVQSLNVSSNEANQAYLFPLLFEILFRPTSSVLTLVDKLLGQLKDDSGTHRQLVCSHIRVGRNPTMVNDEIRSHRDTMVADIVRFMEHNLTITSESLIFITSDSMDINEYIINRYGVGRAVSIPGPITHIDRPSSSHSSAEQCQGFLKVIADFYVLGECDALIMARSGFSEWASRRRHPNEQFNQLYLYCRGVYQVTGHGWRRPHIVC